MDYHRANKLKSTDSTKYQRLPSPMTYISTYNKVCSEENEQTKQCLPIDRKHNNLFLWNDGYVPLNRIQVPFIMEERKKKRKAFQQNTQSHQNNNQPTNHQTLSTHMNTYGQDSITKNQNNSDSDDENLDLHRNYKQIKEKKEEQEMEKRTDLLIKMMQENNANQTRIKQSREDQMLIDNNQRKYFSHTKQQMLELQNHILGSQKISKEIMDRKGLSLRKVLSSIPQDKLMQIIDYKQFHFQKIMNEKILPKKQFRLKSMVQPRFTGEHNYDFNRTQSTKFFNNTTNTFMPGSNNLARSTPNINKPQSQQQLTRTRTNQSRQTLDHKKSTNVEQREAYGLNNQQLLKQKSSLGDKKGMIKQNSIQSQSQKLKKENDQQKIFNYIMDDFGDEEEDQNQNQMEELKVEKKKELRIKSINEVQQTIQKLHEIQQASNNQNNKYQNNLQIPPEIMNQIMSLTYKPKTSLDKMLQHEDEMQRQLFIQSLENTQKQNEKKNFFNYSNYFYGKYSKQNNGLSTKLSQNAQTQNDKFQQDLLNMIDEVDQDHKKINQY